MPRDNDAEYNKLESELVATRATLAKAKGAAETEEERDEVATEQEKVRKIKTREIKGASESTMHAVLDELREVRAAMVDKFNITAVAPRPTGETPAPKVPGAPPASATTESSGNGEWSLSDLFFSK